MFMKSNNYFKIYWAVMLAREEEFSDRLNRQATFQGCTALHYAVLIDEDSIVKALLEAGNYITTILLYFCN